MRRASLLGAAAAAGLAVCAGPAQAHIIATRLGDFYTGGLHPLASLEDPVLWLALGLLAGQQDVRSARWVVPAFPLALLAGLICARLWVLPSVAASVDAGAMVVLGGLLATAVPLAGPAVLGIATALGVLRGVANASGIGPDTNTVLFVAGTMLTGYVVVTLLASASATVRRSGVAWRRIAVRACGSWIMAVGVMLGGYTLAKL